MKLVVTGALGHIGSLLIRQLPNDFENLEIIMIDDLSTQRYASLFNLPTSAKFKFIEGKVQNISLNPLLEGANCLIHLAATTDAAGTAHNPDLVHENNFKATQSVAQACLERKVPLIFPSSTSVYGSQSNLVDEECEELLPQSPYAECKINEENYLKKLFSEGLQGVICRLGTIYGTSPGMRFHTAVNKFCWQAVMEEPLTVWETALHQKRPYLDLEDAVSSFKYIIKNSLFDSHVYNLVTANHTVQDVIDLISQNVSSVNVKLVKNKIMNQLSYEVLNKKFSDTGFFFQGSLKKGIHETIEILKGSHSR